MSDQPQQSQSNAQSALDNKNSVSDKRPSQNQSSMMSQAPRKPEFFLYTRLGQNETKNLKKAATNRDERKVLAQIFNLKTLTSDAPYESLDKIEVLKLDFHYINYNFCKENYFSNEKTSTLIAMLEAVLNKMLERQMNPQQGYNMMRQYLADHSIQRPPFSIAIFTQREVQMILEFALETFLRHFSLYEFAFNPRVELILRTDAVMCQQFNAPLASLDEMEPVDEEETSRLKAFLTFGAHDESRANTAAGEGDNIVDQKGSTITNPDQPESSIGMHQTQEDDTKNDDVDWAKVGRLYNQETPLQAVMDREFARLNKALESKLMIQDEKLMQPKDAAVAGKK